MTHMGDNSLKYLQKIKKYGRDITTDHGLFYSNQGKQYLSPAHIYVWNKVNNKCYLIYWTNRIVASTVIYLHSC